MTKVVFDISMSLDGFVTGPGADVHHGLGIGGEPIHEWVFDAKTDTDQEVLEQASARSGAVLMGRRTFDIVDGPDGWSEDVGYGAEHGPAEPPQFFVVTHSAPEQVRLPLPFTFVTDGVERAVELARDAAGDKDVFCMGGADLGDQLVRAGLVDELVIHVAPVLLGDGTKLFDRLGTAPVRLEKTRVLDTPRATHLCYRVVTD
jgi:dihydrofolate reductase